MSVVHIARFGSSGGAHTLLTATGGDESVLSAAAWYTDLPPQGDSSDLGDFAAGYAIGDWYIAQLTRPDHRAARAGMVMTTVAVLPIDSLSFIDLGATLDALSADSENVHPIPISQLTRPSASRDDTAGATALVAALVRRRRGVWVGPGGIPAIASVWRHLSTTDRRRLTFGAAFHPLAISLPRSDSNLVVATTPPRYAGRWNDWPTVTADSVSDDAAARAVMGEAGEPTRELATALVGTEVSLEQWRLIAAASDRLARLNDINHEALRALAQLVGELTPDPGTGVSVKAAVLSALAASTPEQPMDELRGLRAIPWSAYGGEKDLANLIRDWASGVIANPARSPDLVSAFDESEKNAEDTFWTAVERALTAAAEEDSTGAIAHASTLTDEDDERALAWLGRAVPRDRLDLSVAGAVAGHGGPAWLAPFAKRRGLPRTHAQVVDISDSTQAWRRQLSIRPSDDEANDMLAARIGSAATLESAISGDLEGLRERAAQIVIAQPTLLRGVDVTKRALHRLLLTVEGLGGDPWTVVQPDLVMTEVLDQLTDDEVVDQELLDSLARTSAADISSHPRRASVWNRLPPYARERLLVATADAVARDKTAFTAALEPDLARTILSPTVFGAVAHDDPDRALAILQTLGQADSHHAAILATRGRFTPSQSDRLGRLVKDRRWKQAATVIADLTAARPDLLPAAKQVTDLFGIVDRIARFAGLIGGASKLATRDEIRDAVVDVASELYPAGPSDQSLWQRAGGDDGDIPRAKTGREAWARGIRAIETGARGAPTLLRLLSVIQRDYPRNNNVATLSDAIQGQKPYDHR
ncbi:MAG: hypothetical protein JWR63_3340 [Conexibacter sp.]|nr:hypothetical protein [Conexibacter sp.]